MLGWEGGSCGDVLADGSACKCKFFLEPVDPNAAYRCRECLHGYSQHMRPKLANANAKVEQVDSEQRVLDLIQRRTSRSTSDTVKQAVRNEVLGTYRAGGGMQRAPMSLRTVKNRVRSLTQPLLSKQLAPNEFRVGSFQLLINFMDIRGKKLMRTSLLSRTELETFEKRGCAILEEAAEAHVLCKDWTPEEVDDFFHRIFPKPFAYAARIDKGKGTDPKRHWVLINKQKQQYEVVQGDKPSGKQLYFYRGRPKCPTAETNVIIALRTAVAELEFSFWDPDYEPPSEEVVDSEEESFATGKRMRSLCVGMSCYCSC
ncbi:hypothetical protein BKA82DRAFT_4273406 [Pisolithus tinctorius]|nr:hypothetical protein BKA82DRAFT_4273406 [Pisolithus tinctorius]